MLITRSFKARYFNYIYQDQTHLFMTTPLEKLLILFAFCYLNKIASANIDALHKSVVVELDGITFDHLLKNYQHSIVIFYSKYDNTYPIQENA